MFREQLTLMWRKNQSLFPFTPNKIQDSSAEKPTSLPTSSTAGPGLPAWCGQTPRLVLPASHLPCPVTGWRPQEPPVASWETGSAGSFLPEQSSVEDKTAGPGGGHMEPGGVDEALTSPDLPTWGPYHSAHWPWDRADMGDGPSLHCH